MSKVFISYRREDTAGYAISLHDQIAARFGPDQIFMDIDNIEYGEDFVDAIERKISGCDVMLVLIGRNWVTSQDASGKRRLDSPDDFVRLEVATALDRKIRVIPVLLAGAQMPLRDELPADLVPLTRRNAIALTDAAFRHDVGRLIDSIANVIAPPAPPAGSRADMVSPVKAASSIGLAGTVGEPKRPLPAISKDSAADSAPAHARDQNARKTNEGRTGTTRKGANSETEQEPVTRTGIRIYCESPWTGLGADPECYITQAQTGYSQRNKLKWYEEVFIPLEPNEGYRLAIKRPSDVLSAKATIDFSLNAGEIKKFYYESPVISFMSGDITIKE